MRKIYEVYVLESLKDLEAEEFPFSMWLPYVRLESERFLCKETGEIWHRFEGVTIYSEDDDYPEGDLIEDSEKAPDGFVCWHGKKGTVPVAGDVFRVLDGDNQVVFEETISGESKLYGRKYASAVKEGAFARDLLWDMEQALKSGLGDTFGNNLLNHVELENGSHMEEITNQERLLFSMRGIPFVMFVDEREAHSPCKLTFYEVDGMHVHSYERSLAAGDKWFEVRYQPANDNGPAMCVGWGIGSAKEAAEKVRVVLDKMVDKTSLDGWLAEAIKRADAKDKDISLSERDVDLS